MSDKQESEMTQPFTDEDLNKLKAIEDESSYRFQVDKIHDRWVTLRAFLARLEAAENCMWDAERVLGNRYHPFNELFEKWRKLAGR
jgi:hypothetical protein